MKWIAQHNQLLRFRSNGQPLERSQVPVPDVPTFKPSDPPTLRRRKSFVSYHIPATPVFSCDSALFCATAFRYPLGVSVCPDPVGVPLWQNQFCHLCLPFPFLFIEPGESKSQAFREASCRRAN